MTQRQSRQLLWLTIAFAGLLLFIVIGVNQGAAFFEPFYDFPYGDKISHFLLIGTMAFLLNACLRARTFRIGPRSILLGSFLLAIVVTAEEFSQIFLINRRFDLLDLAANYLGIIILGRLAVRFMKSRVNDDGQTD